MELDTIKNELMYAGTKIDECINHRIFSLEELRDFLKKDINEVFSYGPRELKEYKTRMLYNIYLKPFELYYSKYFEKYLLDDVTDFIKDRYYLESNYIENKFHCGELHRLEYKDMLEKLELYYIYSSNYGIGILRKYIR